MDPRVEALKPYAGKQPSAAKSNLNPRVQALGAVQQRYSRFPTYGTLAAYTQTAPTTTPSVAPQGGRLARTLGSIARVGGGIGKAIITTPTQLVNVGLLGGAGTRALQKYAIAKATGNKAAQEGAIKEYDEYTKNLQTTQGLLGVGLPGQYTPAELAKPLAPARFAKTTGGVGAELASYAIGAGGATRLLPALVKARGVGAGAKALGRIGAVEGVSGALGFGGVEAAKKESTLQSTVKQAGLGAALGAGLGLGLPAAGVAVRGVKKGVTTGIEKTVGQSIKSLVQTETGKKLFKPGQKFYDAVIDTQGPVQRVLKDITETKGVGAGLKASEVADQLRAQVVKSEGRAREAFVPVQKQIGKIADKKTYKADTAAINKYQEALNARKLGKDVEVPVLTPVQKQMYDIWNKGTKKPVQEMFDNGLIDETTYKKFMADNDYIRVQKEVSEELEKRFGKPAGFQIKSLTVQQKLKGGGGAAIDPGAAFVDWTRNVYEEIARSNYTKYVAGKLVESGQGKILRQADVVQERLAAIGEASQLRPLRNQLEKAMKSQAKYTKQLESQLNGLKKQAYKELEKTLNKEVKGQIIPATGPTPENIRGVIDNILSADNATLRKINAKYMRREPKLAKAVEDLTKIKSQYDNTAREINDLVDLTRRLQDAKGVTQNEINYFRKGINEIVEVEPEIAKALKLVDNVQMSKLLQVLAIPGRILKNFATAINPAFILPNVVGDQLYAGIVGKNARKVMNPKTFYLALKDTAADAAGKKFKVSDNFVQYLKDNTNMTSFDLGRNVKKAVDEAADLAGVTRGFGKARAVTRKAEDIFATGETLTRYQNWAGTYKLNRDMGLSAEQSAFRANIAARKNSVDFSKSGQATMFLRFFDPYINASFQGAAQTAQAFRQRPIGTSLKVGSLLVMPTMGLTYWNYSDPKRALTYQRIPEYEKDTNMIFVKENGDGYIKIKLPPGLRSLTKPFRNMVEAEYVGDRQGFLETANDLLIEPFVPEVAKQGFGGLIPQAIKPLVEAQMNRSFYFGQDIIGQEYQKLPTEEQVYKNTSQAYRDIGNLLNVSPEKVKSVLRGYFPGAGEQLIENVDWLRKNVLGQDITVGKRTTSEQVTSRFYKEAPTTTGAVGTKFYERLAPIRQERESTNNKINEAIKNNDYQKAKSLANELNKKLDDFEKTYKTTYGKYETDTKLLQTLNDLKISTSDRSFKSRKKRLESK